MVRRNVSHVNILDHGILLFVGMDGNTTDKEGVKLPKKRKISSVDPLLKDLHMARVRYEAEEQGGNVDTVRKERSTFQLQLKKIHQPSEAISDTLVYSGSEACCLSIRDSELSAHGPNLQCNPSDHRALVATFRMKQ